MISLTRKSDYALVALASLAQQRGGGKTVSARRIAQECGLPPALLMNILKELTHAGLVISARGPQGGYSLAGTPGQVTILDVITAIEGPVRVALCVDEKNHGQACCPMIGACKIEQPIRKLNQRLCDFLKGMTLADLVETRVPVGLEGKLA